MPTAAPQLPPHCLNPNLASRFPSIEREPRLEQPVTTASACFRVPLAALQHFCTGVIDCNSVSWSVAFGSDSLCHRNIWQFPTEELQEHNYRNQPPGEHLQDHLIPPAYAPSPGNDVTSTRPTTVFRQQKKI